MSDRQLIADLLSALEYHTEQTRPIEFSRVAIEAAREYLRKPAQQQYQNTADKCELTPVPAKGGLLPAQQEHKPWCASLSNLFFDARPCDCKRVPLPAGDYEAGWNSALEMAAFKLQHDFKRSFGEDTLASIAVYIKEMKK